MVLGNFRKGISKLSLIGMMVAGIVLPNLSLGGNVAHGQELGSVMRNVISPGNASVHVVKPDGTVWGWGVNDQGYLGDGTKTHQYEPVKVLGLTDVVSITATSNHKFAIKSDGTVWGWGKNNSGQLGIGERSSNPILTPIQIEGLADVKSIVTGADHSYAIKSDGTVWGWGANNNGILGNGTTGTMELTPIQLENMSDFITIEPTQDRNYALKDDGTVWMWGRNDSKRLTSDGKDILSPVQVDGLSEIMKISAGGVGVLALKADGTVWVRGQDEKVVAMYTPIQVEGLTDVIDISRSGDQNFALKSDGTVWAWGATPLNNKYGQLGVGTNDNSYEILQVKGLTDVISIEFPGYAFKSDGTVWTWGRNNFGQLGDGTKTDSNVPVQMTFAVDLGVTDIVDDPNVEDGGNESPAEDTGGESVGSNNTFLELEGGGLYLETSPINPFGLIKLEGEPKVHSTSFEKPLKVTDSRGTQEGWNLSVSATQFEVVEPEGGFAEGTSANLLPIGTFSLSPLSSIDRVGEGTGIMPKSLMSHNMIIDDGAVAVANAEVGAGMGEFDLVFTEDALSVVIDPNTAKLDTVNYPESPTPYESTVTWSLVTGP